MGWLQMNWLFIAVIIFVRFNGFQCCLEEERRSLLEIKNFFVLNNDEPEAMLLSWIDEKDSNCCHWERVTCDPTSGRIVELDLANLRAFNLFDFQDHLLNVSLFAPFNEIQSLDISGNDFVCCANNTGFEKLLPLKRLEKLNLAFNGFNDSIVKPLGTLKPLKFLNLSRNDFGALFPIRDISALWNLEILDLSYNSFEDDLQLQDTSSLSLLRKLEHLDLGNNHFNKHILKSVSNLEALKFLSLEKNDLEGPISSKDLDSLNSLEVLILRENQLTGPLPIQDLISFKNLNVLDLSKNNFTGRVPQNIGLLSSLLALSLAENNLTGSLPTKGLCELENLQELDLSLNSFEGQLPRCLTNLSSLRVLDLSMNQFKGDVSFLISNVTSLEHIILSNNDFEGKFYLSLLANHSELEILELMNMGNLDVETENSNWTSSFQLKVLMLSNCNLNRLSGDIPTFLSHQHTLKVVDLSHNYLRGSFPNWLIQNNAGLEVLHLRNNSFDGQLLLPRHLNVSIFWFDVSNNRLTGQVGEDMGRKLLNIQYLNLSRNYFDGVIKSSFCNMTNLIQLDLSFNFFSGEIPKELIAGCVDLSILKLSSNKFNGEIISPIFNLTRTMVLRLENNSFSGTVSNAITRSSIMTMLDISNNHFSGDITSWISNMTNFKTILMYNNFFRGQLPCQLAVYGLLDISLNSLSGPLPSCSNMLDHLLLHGNKFTGPIPEAFLNSTYLLTLDLRNNLLSGRIPDSIQALSNLRILLLGSNHLNGFIPNQICNLKKVSLMDLSDNKISGIIPHCINNISFGNFGRYDQVYRLSIYFTWTRQAICTYGNFLVRTYKLHADDGYDELVKVEFVTKRLAGSYKGDILNYMSGLDFSCNNLTGEIPIEIGDLSSIHAANFSHNSLMGPIPRTFSSLSQLESLDLSYNRLSGEIPVELLNLHFLAVFSVAYNNLSGRIPDMREQFGTFDSSSYEGNPNLCGPQLNKDCFTIGGSPKTSNPENINEKWYKIDITDFYPTFVVSYVIFLLAVILVLYINPFWQRRLFEFVEGCYYRYCC